jgi:hypothetical protein
MRRRIAVFGVVLSLTAATAIAGCFLLTGSTSGYTQVQAEAGCEAAADCTGDGGAGVCCFSATSGAAACQAAPCGALEVQLCATRAECTQVECIPQSCTLAGASFSVRACGSIPAICTPED